MKGTVEGVYRKVGRVNLLQVICLLAGPNVQRLYSSRCCVFSLSFPYLSSIIQSISSCLGLPLPLFCSILPSIISLCRELPLTIQYNTNQIYNARKVTPKCESETRIVSHQVNSN